MAGFIRRSLLATAAILTLAGSVKADLKPGEPLPNPTLTTPAGEKSQLHGMLSSVTILHLWKCD